MNIDSTAKLNIYQTKLLIMSNCPNKQTLFVENLRFLTNVHFFLLTTISTIFFSYSCNAIVRPLLRAENSRKTMYIVSF